jgi:hypothetical protein
MTNPNQRPTLAPMSVVKRKLLGLSAVVASFLLFGNVFFRDYKDRDSTSGLELVQIGFELASPFVSEFAALVSYGVSELLLRLVAAILKRCCIRLSLEGYPLIKHAGCVAHWLASAAVQLVVSKMCLGFLFDLVDHWRCIGKPSDGIDTFVCSLFWPWILQSQPFSTFCSKVDKPAALCVYVMPLFTAALQSHNGAAATCLGCVVLGRGLLSVPGIRKKSI